MESTICDSVIVLFAHSYAPFVNLFCKTRALIPLCRGAQLNATLRWIEIGIHLDPVSRRPGFCYPPINLFRARLIGNTVWSNEPAWTVLYGFRALALLDMTERVVDGGRVSLFGLRIKPDSSC